MPATDLTGTTVVVTGAGGRLGTVLAQTLLDAGATVAGLDAHPTDSAPDGVVMRVADLTDETAVAEAFEAIEKETGSIGALVHTVGMWDGQPFAETALADWQRMMDVNLTTSFLCLREAARRMAVRGGRIVGIASRQGSDGAVAQQGAYSVSKAGVMRLVEAIAAEYDGHITAAAVAPSMILFGGEDEDAKGVAVEDIAALCAYLCGDGGAIHNGTVLRAYGTG